MASSLLLVTHIILSACLGGVYSLECYSCSYTNSSPEYMPACKDPIDVSDPSVAQSVMSCDGVCSKSTIVKDNVTAVSRECLDDMMMSECDNKCSTSEEEGTVCFHCCDTDRCNGEVVSKTTSCNDAQGTDGCNGAGSVTYDLLTSFTVFACFFYLSIS